MDRGGEGGKGGGIGQRWRGWEMGEGEGGGRREEIEGWEGLPHAGDRAQGALNLLHLNRHESSALS